MLTRSFPRDIIRRLFIVAKKVERRKKTSSSLSIEKELNACVITMHRI